MTAYALTRIKRRWVPEWLWRRLFCHAIPKLTVRYPLLWILTRKVSEFEDFKHNRRVAP